MNTIYSCHYTKSTQTPDIPYGPHLSELASRAKGTWNLRACPGLNQSAPPRTGGQLPTWEEGWGQ